jgi:hypothetical protein
MKRKLSLIVVLAFVVVVASVVVRHVWEQRMQRKREVAYQMALLSYSTIFRPGMTRKNVEQQLRVKGTAFQEMCCIDERSAYAGLLRIGKEKVPWFCNEQNIYIALQFVAVERHEPWRAYDSDALKRTTSFRWLDGCL